MRLPIHGWVKTSLLDYPGHIASSIFLARCNFRCPYCHNADLVLAPEDNESPYSVDEVLVYLRHHQRTLEAICLSGGEPLLHEGVPEFLGAVRSVGLKIKVDTNGSCPKMLERLLKDGLVDYVAMDVKGPLEKIPHITRTTMPQDHLRRSIEASVTMLKDQPGEYEFRTTVVPGLLEEKDFEDIGRWLQGSRRFVLQQFRPGHTLDPAYSLIRPFPAEYLQNVANRMKRFIENCTIRGIG